MKPRRFSVSLDVRNAMAELVNQKEGPTYFADQNGKPLSTSEALAALAVQVAKGYNRMPMSRDCRNPCVHADKGCTGFDYQKGGCPGYEVDR